MSRGVRPKRDLIRFVLDPQGQVTPDLAEKLPGRGVWVCADRSHIELAVKRQLFARAFKSAATAPVDLAEHLAMALGRRALDTLGLALRAGEVICGFDKVASRLDGARKGRQ
ncbi:MAG: DUF448 domain-containing protein [Pseudomonadota bacterium]